jgi:hypothetical protein
MSAIEYFKSFAEQGNADCQYSLAYLLLGGYEGDKDEKQAVEWLRKSAAQGHTSAQLRLGICLELGTGCDKDEEKALEYYRKAAAYNHHEDEKARDEQNAKFKAQRAKESRDAQLRLEGKIAYTTDYFWAQVSKSKQWYLGWIPNIVNQQEGYCGLAAFAGAVNNSGYLPKPIYASSYEKRQTKSLEDKDDSDILLYQLTKNPSPVEFAIYDVDFFEELAKKVNVPGKAVKLDQLCTEDEYSKAIREALNNEYVLLLPCDNGDNDMPTINGGTRTHWVLGFGYWGVCDNDYKIAVTHHGKYCIWSLRDLYKSNQQLPNENPLVKNEKLDKFRFTFFKIPTKSRHYLDRPELPQHEISATCSF